MRNSTEQFSSTLRRRFHGLEVLTTTCLLFVKHVQGNMAHSEKDTENGFLRGSVPGGPHLVTDQRKVFLQAFAKGIPNLKKPSDGLDKLKLTSRLVQMNLPLPALPLSGHALNAIR